MMTTLKPELIIKAPKENIIIGWEPNLKKWDIMIFSDGEWIGLDEENDVVIMHPTHFVPYFDEYNRMVPLR